MNIGTKSENQVAEKISYFRIVVTCFLVFNHDKIHYVESKMWGGNEYYSTSSFPLDA